MSIESDNSNSSNASPPLDKQQIINTLLTDSAESPSRKNEDSLSSDELNKLLVNIFEESFSAHSLFQQDAHSLTNSLLPLLAEQQIKLSSAARNTLELVDRLFTNLIDNSALDFAIQKRISSLRIPYFLLLLETPSLITQNNHPIRILLNQMIASGLLWDPNESKSDQIFNQISQSAEKVIAAVNSERSLLKVCMSVANQLDEFSKSLVKRAEIFERRMREAEEGQAKAESAKIWANHCINRILRKGNIPEFARQMLTNAWTHVVFLERLKFSESPTNEKADAAKMLVISLQPISTIQELESFLEIQPGLIEELHKGLERSSFSYAEANDFFESLNEYHNAMLIEIKTGLSAPSASEEIIRLKPSDIFDNENTVNADQKTSSDTHSEVSALDKRFNSIADVEIGKTEIDACEGLPVREGRKHKDDIATRNLIGRLKPGRWIEIQTESGLLRCKFSTYIDISDKYIFVNGSGNKIAEYSTTELQEAWQLKRIMFHQETPLFESALKSVIGDLQRNYQEFENKRRQLDALEMKRLAKVEQQKTRQKQEREKLENSRKGTTSTSLNEHAVEELPADNTEQIKTATTSINDTETFKSLNVGSWVEIQVGYKLTKCRLAAKIASTGKLIFTDRGGIKVKECFEQDLLELYQSGKLKFDGDENYFDSALANVISNMRGKKNDLL